MWGKKKANETQTVKTKEPGGPFLDSYGQACGIQSLPKSQESSGRESFTVLSKGLKAKKKRRRAL